MRLPRLKIRTLMILVALVAVLIGAGVEGTRLWWVSVSYRAEASAASNFEKFSRQLLLTKESSFMRYSEAMALDYWEEAERELSHYLNCGPTALIVKNINYYHFLRVKYERAASHPWEYVAPDPPEPD